LILEYNLDDGCVSPFGCDFKSRVNMLRKDISAALKKEFDDWSVNCFFKGLAEIASRNISSVSKKKFDSGCVSGIYCFAKSVANIISRNISAIFK
jgi:hypothetical protein